MSDGRAPGVEFAPEVQVIARDWLAKAGEQEAVQHPSVAERVARGRAARDRMPREGLARWSPAADRADPVDLLTGQEQARVPELLPVRHARMATSAFAFYRGAALVMAADLAPLPRTELAVQLCGDAHLSNFGLFASPDRSVIFDVNDFDETHPGPFEWDVKRLATSFVLAARDNGLPEDVGRAASVAVCAAYRHTITDFATRGELDIWYARIDAGALESAIQEWVAVAGKERGKSKKSERKTLAAADQTLTKSIAKARSRDAWSAISKITEVVDGRRQFRSQPPLLVRLDVGDDVHSMVNALFREFRSTLQADRRELLQRYEIVDIGHKVVGVGSVGLLAFVLLMRGRDEDDLMVLQVKQAQASVLEAFTQPSVYAQHGERVVTGQRLMQAASDSFLGWLDGPGGRSYYVRQLRDMKWSPDPGSLSAERLPRFALLCGHTLARAHARGGDAIALAAYLGTGRKFDESVTEFALSYADQVELDFATFTSAIADGRLHAHEDSSGAEGTRAAEQFSRPAGKKSGAKGRPRLQTKRTEP